jgi:hypothetical protein
MADDGVVRNMQTDINLILAEYEDAAAAHAGTRLADWIEKFPEHSEALADFAMANSTLRQGTEPHEDTNEEARWLQSAIAAGGKTRSELAPQAIRSILTVAKDAGMSPQTLAGRIGIGLAVLAKLDRRLLRVSTIPRALVTEIAEALQLPVRVIVSYIRLAPTLSASASYKASKAPRVRQETFAGALADCPGMDEDLKRRWIAESDMLAEGD